jgi:hypothetical protein
MFSLVYRRYKATQYLCDICPSMVTLTLSLQHSCKDCAYCLVEVNIKAKFKENFSRGTGFIKQTWNCLMFDLESAQLQHTALLRWTFEPSYKKDWKSLKGYMINKANTKFSWYMTSYLQGTRVIYPWNPTAVAYILHIALLMWTLEPS